MVPEIERVCLRIIVRVIQIVMRVARSPLCLWKGPGKGEDWSVREAMEWVRVDCRDRPRTEHWVPG